jgi:exodeoxyribonuclease-3
MLDLWWLWYHLIRHTWSRPGYAGTCIYTRRKPDYSINHFANPLLHADWRTIELWYDGLTIINCYFPNGGTRADGSEMLTYKLHFYDQMIAYLQTRSEHTLIIGDFNIAHTEIDLARPQENINNIWFTIVERQKIESFLQSGFVDVFRDLNPEKIEYTWWSYRSGAKQRNIWRRIDYACVSTPLQKNVIWFQHHVDIKSSDHCPLEIIIS